MNQILASLLVFSLSLLPLSTHAQKQSKATPKRPNIVVILSDDQGYGDLSIHGNPQVNTPNLDRFATNNIQFKHFFVSPLCAPTRASFLTGRYSLRTGVKGVARGEETMLKEETTIAEVLRDSGYRTGIFGKWHNGENYPYTPQGQGFEQAFGFNLGHWNNYFDTTLKQNGKEVKTKGFITDLLTDNALRFIETNHNSPFFCYIAYNVPHTPLQVPDKYFNAYKAKGLDDWLAAIYGMCENMDANVGRVLAKLDALNLRDNTIVLFFSDNGPHGARYNAGMRGLKGTLHEGGSRVPCFLSWPARFRSPKIIPQIAAHIDLYPTLLDLCGIVPPNTSKLDGLSLVPLLEGKSAKWPDRILFCQHQSPFKRGNKTGALRTQQYRLVNEGRGWELFDMQNDPGQKQPFGIEKANVKAELIAKYENWWQQVLPTASQPVPPISVGYAEENPVVLSVPQSDFNGGIQFNGKHANNGWLSNWTNLNATVEWNIDVIRAGTYEVNLAFLCPKTDAGARLRISSDSSATEVTVPGTDYKQVPSPDRVPRDEVYEMEWCSLKAGVLDLKKGSATLKLQAVSKPGNQVIELKNLSLKKMD